MEMLTRLNDTLAIVLQKLDEHDSKLNELDSVLYDGIVGPANDQIAQQEYDQALSDFRCKYAEQLDPYAGAVQAIDGEDVYQRAFDSYNDSDTDISPDEYVTQLAESLKNQIAAVKEALGSDSNVEVEVKADTPEGDVEIKTDGDKVETSTDEDKDGEPESETEEVKDESESLEDFEKSLREELDKEKGPLIKQ